MSTRNSKTLICDCREDISGEDASRTIEVVSTVENFLALPLH
jgi:hypothetical protein